MKPMFAATSQEKSSSTPHTQRENYEMTLGVTVSQGRPSVELSKIRRALQGYIWPLTTPQHGMTFWNGFEGRYLYDGTSHIRTFWRLFRGHCA